MTESLDRLTVAQIRMRLTGAEGRALTRLLGALAQDERAGVVEACRCAQARQTARRRETERTRGMYALECELHGAGFVAVAGVDEVGRGALAGPVTAAAVILAADDPIEGLNDSKKLSPARREELAILIHQRAIAVGISHVSADEIDATGLAAALRKAVLSAIGQLQPRPDHVVVDGLPMRVHSPETAVVKGDSKVAAVAAASIVAKVARDAIMREAALSIPHYGFEVNKGYGTVEHLQAVVEHGPSTLHRRTFCGGGGEPTLF